MGLLGCGTDPVAPTVSIIAQAPSSLVVGLDEQDDVSLRLAYEDGDGDLGGGILIIRDCRDARTALELPIPPIAAPEEVEDARPISGELLALVPDIAVAAPGATPSAVCQAMGVLASTEELVLCVELIDDAGQKSNRACSAPFAVTVP